jgi:hypothetical protein
MARTSEAFPDNLASAFEKEKQNLNRVLDEQEQIK